MKAALQCRKIGTKRNQRFNRKLLTKVLQWAIMILFSKAGDALPHEGPVKVSTGVLQLEKLSACNALNGKLNINAEEKTQLAFAA